MLSSAHVLAMDAKNLLDVVDNIRIQYPHVNSHILRGAGLSASSTLGTASSASSSAHSSLEKQRKPPDGNNDTGGKTSEEASFTTSSDSIPISSPSVAATSQRSH